MSLEVLGAGFGRTGTASLKRALEILDFGPCYHMEEVIHHPDHVAFWDAAWRGDEVDWDAFLGPYPAAVDWPVTAFWRILARRFPRAKVILTVRDPEAWYRSCADTIFQLMGRELEVAGSVAQLRMATDIVARGTFDGHLDDEAHCIDVFDRHTAAVRAALPPDRLLQYRVADGWAPLCDFLEVPRPGEPYPSINTTDEFRALAGLDPDP